MERKVYVLSNTDDSKFKYDGGNIIGVFGSLESAKEKVEEVKKEIEKNYSGSDLEWRDYTPYPPYNVECVERTDLYINTDIHGFISSNDIIYITEWDLIDLPRNIKSSYRK